MEAHDGPQSEADVFLDALNALPPNAVPTDQFLRNRLRAVRNENARLRVDLASADSRVGELSNNLAEAHRQLDAAGRLLAELDGRLRAAEGSRAWRLAHRLRRTLSSHRWRRRAAPAPNEQP